MAIVDGKVVFDETEQAEVDRIIGERLARAKAEKPADYDDLKEIESEIGEFFEGATPAEKKEAIRAYKAEVKAQKELEELEKQAKATGKDPDLLKAIQTLEKKIESLEGERNASKQAVEQKQQQEENWTKQVNEFKEANEDIDLEKLNKDEDFIEYASGRSGTLKTLYEGYVKFTSKLREKTADEITAKFKAKELGSTGSGKGGKGDAGEYGLTDRQKTLAKANGMSYKDYAGLMKYVD
jgi:DNA repair exonuclease SbcCD ATPase subunit